MNFTPQQQHSLLSKMGYNGPVDSNMMDAFLSSNPGAAAKMGKFDRVMKKGFALGGFVPEVPTTRNNTSGFAPGVTPPVSTIGGPAPLPETPTETPQDFTSGLNTIYQDELGRDAGSAGLGFYLPYLQSGQMNLDQVRQDVQKNKATENLVNQLYQENAGRAGDPAGLNFYIQKLNSGEMTADQIGSQIRAAASGERDVVAGEAIGPTDQSGIQSALERVQTTGRAGVDYWTEQLRLSQQAVDQEAVSTAQEQLRVARESGDEEAISAAEEALKVARNDDAQQAAMAGLQRAQQDLNSDLARLRNSLPTTSEMAATALTDPMSMVTQATPPKMTVGEGQLVDPSAGVPTSPVGQAGTTTVGTTSQAATPEALTAAQMTAQTVSPAVRGEVESLQAAQGTVRDQAQIEAQLQVASSVSKLQAAQGEAIMMDNPVQREIQQGELVSGSAVDATKVEEMNAQLQAAQATPSDKATVQGQLEDLMQQFEGGNTPAWAAGAMRNANAMLAQRGLGASSMAGQAVIQAAMESALPIAQADANTRAQFESQNLSNRQQVAMFAAQQRAAFLQQEFDQDFQARVQNSARIADVANMNFTAEQQIALENSRAANTMNLSNLSNRQAMVIAEASALANLDLSNLNNRQQAAVQNAQNFLQMDMANLNNQQQTAIFKSQQIVNSMLSDQAAENAAAQFNAASENQTNQFFADLQSTISRFNADQMNGVAKFNAGEANATARFNESLAEQRQQFEASNRLIVAQANAKWRQDIATANTAMEHEALMESVKAANGMTTTAIDNAWQRERDLMDFAYRSSESEKDRNVSILLADKELEAAREKLDAQADMAKGAATMDLIFDAADTLFS